MANLLRFSFLLLLLVCYSNAAEETPSIGRLSTQIGDTINVKDTESQTKKDTSQQEASAIPGDLAKKDKELQTKLAETVSALSAQIANQSDLSKKLELKNREIIERKLAELELRKKADSINGNYNNLYIQKQKELEKEKTKAKFQEMKSNEFYNKWKGAADGLRDATLNLGKANETTKKLIKDISSSKDSISALIEVQNQTRLDLENQKKKNDTILKEAKFKALINYSMFGFVCLCVMIGIASVIVYFIAGKRMNDFESVEFNKSLDHLHRHTILQFAFYRKASKVFRFLLLGGIFSCGFLFIIAGTMLIVKADGVIIFSSDGWKNITIIFFPIVFLVTALNAIETKKIEMAKLLNELRQNIGSKSKVGI